MKLADAVFPHPRRPRPDAEIDEMLAHAGPLDEPDVVTEVIADGEKRILRVHEIVVPGRRSLSRDLAAVDSRRKRLRHESVQTECAHEPEIRIDAGHLIPVAAAAARLARQKDRPDIRVAQNVAPAAKDGVVVSGTAAFRLGLNRHGADAVPAGAAGQATARDHRELFSRISEADPT